MTIPDFQTLMLPVLQYYGDKIEHTKQEAIDALANTFNLTDEEKNALLSSGSQFQFNNKVSWAITYLLKSGLLNRTSRGRYKITDKGSLVLNEKPEKITTKYLEKFPGYLEFKSYKREVEAKNEDNETNETKTPKERLESSYIELRTQLSHDLLERVMLRDNRYIISRITVPISNAS